MLTLEAECLLEHCRSRTIASVIMHLIALSKVVCTQTGAQVRCTHRKVRKECFSGAVEITPRRPLGAYWCSMNLIIKIQGLSPCIIAIEA